MPLGCCAKDATVHLFWCLRQRQSSGLCVCLLLLVCCCCLHCTDPGGCSGFVSCVKAVQVCVSHLHACFASQACTQWLYLNHVCKYICVFPVLSSVCTRQYPHKAVIDIKAWRETVHASTTICFKPPSAKGLPREQPSVVHSSCQLHTSLLTHLLLGGQTWRERMYVCCAPQLAPVVLAACCLSLRTKVRLIRPSVCRASKEHTPRSSRVPHSWHAVLFGTSCLRKCVC